jgi:hypothetical protein
MAAGIGSRAVTPHVAEEPRKIDGELVEHQPQQSREALGRVAGQAWCEAPEFAEGLAVPPTRDERRSRQPECLQVPQQDEAVHERRRRLLLGLAQQPGALGRPLRRLGAADAFVEPALQPLAPAAVRLAEPGVPRGHRKTVAPFDLVADGVEQPSPQLADRPCEILLGVCGQHRHVAWAV